jgi:hypothetical protein
MDDLRVERRGGGYGRSNYAGPIYTGLAIWRQWFGASLYADNKTCKIASTFLMAPSHR